MNNKFTRSLRSKTEGVIILNLLTDLVVNKHVMLFVLLTYRCDYMIYPGLLLFLSHLPDPIIVTVFTFFFLYLLRIVLNHVLLRKSTLIFAFILIKFILKTSYLLFLYIISFLMSWYHTLFEHFHDIIFLEIFYLLNSFVNIDMNWKDLDNCPILVIC